VFSPVEINALVEFGEPVQSTSNWSIDTVYTISIYFHDKELVERNVEPREGDFVKWGDIFYEIKTLTRPQLVFGQVENKVMLKAECRVSRESNFVIKDQE